MKRGPVMQVVLVMFRSEGDRRSFSIVRDVTVIGRREDCDLRIPLGEVSRKHCRLIKEEEGLVIEDMGSSNGTYHNGRRVQSARLQPGDTLTVGPISFVVQLDGVPAEDDLHPIPASASRAAMQASSASDSSVIHTNGELAPGSVSHGPAAHGSETQTDFDPMSALTGPDPDNSRVDSAILDELARTLESEPEQPEK